MKIIVDVLGAPAESGGMRLYAEEVVRSWKDKENDDTLFVLGGDWIREAFCDLDYVVTREVRSRQIIGRSFGQFLVVAQAYWSNRADAVLSISPVVTPLIPRRARHCVVHDWRHINHPEEFTAPQRLYRRIWRASVSWAGHASAISEKTLRETLDLVPTAQVSLVENGHDHPKRWAIGRSPTDLGGGRRILTFGHQSNKRPTLVIDAVALLPSELLSSSTVMVLGARGAFATELRVQATQLGLKERLELPGFVDMRDYERLIASASVIVMASTDEGFGLPIVEARYFGIPAIATTDSGLGLIHGQGVIVSEPTPKALSSAIEAALARGVVAGSRRHIRSWGKVTEELRLEIDRAGAGDSRSTAGWIGARLASKP